MRDGVVRDNYYSGTSAGVYFNFNPGLSAARSAKSLTKGQSPNEKVATFEAADGAPPLNVAVGDAVTITGAQIDNLPAPVHTYNDTYSVLDLIYVNNEKRKFTYEMKVEPSENADAPSTFDPSDPLAINFFSRWQLRRFVCENNLFDFYAFDSSSALPPRGMQSVAFSGGPPFMFPWVVVRDNLFQYLNGAAAVAMNGAHSFAFRLGSFENTLIEGNLISLADPNLIHHFTSRNVSAFNNRTPDGTGLPLFDDTGGGGAGPFQREDNLEDEIQDALVLSLL